MKIQSNITNNLNQNYQTNINPDAHINPLAHTHDKTILQQVFYIFKIRKDKEMKIEKNLFKQKIQEGQLKVRIVKFMLFIGDQIQNGMLRHNLTIFSYLFCPLFLNSIILGSMPFLNRSINPNFQAVKQEALDSDLLESHNQEQNRQAAEGKWNQEQNLSFVIFVSYYSDIFSRRQKRKAGKIFKTMEKHLQGRTAAQCRSHFQKIMLKFKTVAKLKKFYQAHYGRQVFQEELKKFKASWEETHPPHSFKDQSIRQYREFGVQTQQCPPLKIEEQPVISCSMLTPGQACNGRLAQLPLHYFFFWHQLNQQYLNYYCTQPSMERKLQH